jgi:hypothetical protein
VRLRDTAQPADADGRARRSLLSLSRPPPNGSIVGQTNRTMDHDALVFVEVRDFPGGQLTPVRARREHGSCYRLLDASSDPEHDVWAFESDAVVRCERREFGVGESDLVAVAKCGCAAEDHNA